LCLIGLGAGLGTAGSILPLGPSGLFLVTLLDLAVTKAEYCWNPTSFFFDTILVLVP
jgi:hypothetical protein